MFKKVYIMYCPVCGYVDGEHTKTVCPFCGHELSNSNHLLKEMRGKFRWEIEPIAEDIFQNLVKDNPEDVRSLSCMNRVGDFSVSLYASIRCAR